MKKNQKLQKAILTPSTKAEKGEHDRSVSRDGSSRWALLSAAGLRRGGARCARALFAFGQEEAPRRGLILVDTKYEIGRRPDGALVLHRRDPHAGLVALLVCGRLRGAASRAARSRAASTRSTCARLLAEQGYRGDGPPPPLSDEVRVEAARRYIQVCELVTGRPFEPDTEEPNARIRRNLGMMTAKVFVTLKKAVLDPQGKSRAGRARQARLPRGARRARRPLHRDHAGDRETMILVEAPVSYPRKKSGSESHSIKLRMSWILWRWHDTPRGGAEREQTTAGDKGGA